MQVLVHYTLNKSTPDPESYLTSPRQITNNYRCGWPKLSVSTSSNCTVCNWTLLPTTGGSRHGPRTWGFTTRKTYFVKLFQQAEIGEPLRTEPAH
ncbi:hypothetical protein RRG08_025927 [Elysia crispata]|uniref:Uncharacterized protein n=1 Tax=Elysia crispata TaxID=231223 RepID=A0AAE0ZZ75_9GAST|nr:hypothetical protein RRG08_025927 [Elysia crispata]